MNIHLEKGVILHEQGRSKLAVEEFTQALAEEPDNIEAISFLALNLAFLGDHAQALEKIALALSTAPDNPWVHHIAGLTYWQAGDRDRAIASLRESVRINPRFPNYRSCLANMIIQQGLYADALAHADQGLACNPEHVGCLLARAAALMFLERDAEAAATLERVLQLAPNDPRVHSLRGWLEYHGDNPSLAKTHFLESLRNDPEHNSDALSGLANAQHDLDDANQEEVRRLTKEGAALLASDSGQALKLFGQALALCTPAASYHEIDKLYSLYGYVFVLLQLLETASDNAKAKLFDPIIKYCEQALELADKPGAMRNQPEEKFLHMEVNRVAGNALAFSLAEGRGEPAKALEAVERAAKCVENYSHYYILDTKVRILLKLKRFDEAFAIAAKVLSERPDFAGFQDLKEPLKQYYKTKSIRPTKDHP